MPPSSHEHAPSKVGTANMPRSPQTPELALIEGGHRGLIRRLIRALATHQDARLSVELDRLERRATLKVIGAQASSDLADRSSEED